MTIESSSVLSGFITIPGSGSVSASIQLPELSGLIGSAPSGTAVEPFSTALMQQINLLSQSAVADLSPSTTPVLTQDQTTLPTLNETLASQTNSQQLPEQLNYTGVAQQISALLKQPESMQEISMLLGKQLPVAKKQGKEINLDETMQTLADILGRLSNVVSDPAIQNIVPATDNSLAAQPSESQNTVQVDSTNQSKPDLIAEGAVSPLLAEQSVGVMPQQSSTATITDVALADVASNLPAQLGDIQSSLPTTAQQKVLDEQINTVKNQLGAPLSIVGQDMLASKKTVADAGNNPGSAPNETNANIDNFTKTLLSLQDTQLNTSNVKALVGDLGLKNQAAGPIEQSVDSSTLSRVTGDIQQLGRQQGMADKVDMPAMTKHLYSTDWSQELGSKILWMSNQNISSADLKLNPQHLGPISIRIDMQQDQASISFTAHNAGVREMLEASIPKLREMLGSQQLNLVDVNVSQQSFSGQGYPQAQNFQQSDNGRRQPRNDAESIDEADGFVDAGLNGVTDEIEQSRALVTNGLVSLYA